MSYYNINTLTPWSDASVRHISNPTDADRHAHGRRELVPFAAPEGMVAIPGTRRIERDGDTVRERYDVETPEQAAARETVRIAALIPEWGLRVSALAGLLGTIGMTIPTTPEAVAERCLTLFAQGNTAAIPVELTIKDMYEILAPVQSDVRAIWEAEATGRLTAETEAAAKAIEQNLDEYERRMKAVVLVLIDEVNLLRGWVTGFKAEVAAATSLADLKARVATTPNMPARTGVQAKAVIAAKVAELQG